MRKTFSWKTKQQQKHISPRPTSLSSISTRKKKNKKTGTRGKIKTFVRLFMISLCRPLIELPTVKITTNSKNNLRQYLRAFSVIWVVIVVALFLFRFESKGYAIKRNLQNRSRKKFEKY
jgi:hypothetical protein